MGNFLSISPLGILTPNNKEACDSNLCLDVMSKSDGIYHSLGNVFYTLELIMSHLHFQSHI